MSHFDLFAQTVPELDLAGGTARGHGGGTAFLHGASLALEDLPGEIRILDQIGSSASSAAIRIGHRAESFSEK